MRPHDWQAGFFYTPALAQITVSSVKFRLALSEIA